MVIGQLGNLTAQDTMTNPNTPYEMIGLRTSEESSLLTFEYVSPNDEERARMRNEGAYDSSLKLRMSSVQVNFWQAAVMRTWNYLQSGVLGTLTSATANAMAKRAAAILDVEVSATSIDIEVESPLVLLPTSAGGSVGLRADLGRMGVKNTLVRKMEEMEGTIVDGEGSKDINLDEIHVTLEQMKVDSVDFASVAAAFDGIGVQMLQDVKMDVLVERGVGNTVGRALTVTGRGGELACDCSKMQYELFIRVFMQNLARRGDPLRDRSLSAPATPQKRLNRSSHLSPSTSIAASPSAAAAADGGSSAAIPPVEMRISFILPLLTVRLSDNKVFGYTMKNLARVDLRKMQLDYASGGGHMDVHLSLQSLQIEDEAMQGRLPIADSVADDAKADLLDLRYTSNQDPGESGRGAFTL